jgi:UDP-N-acetyl-D-mannosaminuronate dehydrogenase
MDGARVLLLGVTYKKDVPDLRETPAAGVARRLRDRGARLTYHDPYVSDWHLDGAPVRRAGELDAELVAADLVILLQVHSAYDLEKIGQRAGLLLDTRGATAAGEVL